MSFRCDSATLARLEWPRVQEWLAREAATARGAEACRGDLFRATRQGARDALAETSEARGLFDAGEAAPFGGAADLRALVETLSRGASAGAEELARLHATLGASSRLRAFFAARGERVPRLASLAGTLPELRALERRLAGAIAPEGGVREDASRELERALRALRDCEREIERRMATLLRDPEIAPHLQEHYTTFREGRPVLPVRADARRRVSGIVHDVSSSGTTVFIEPEGVVELGNRLRLARTEVDREVERILRELSDAARASLEDIEALLATLETLDVACARGRLSQKLGAEAPACADAAAVALRGLRHPLLLLESGLAPEQIVANDLVLPAGARGLVISGPNAGGKTVFAKAVALAALSLRAGLHVCCEPGSAFPLLDAVWADIGDEQDLRAGLSTFSARMSNLARIAAAADERTLVVADEVGDGTEPGEGAALAQAILEALVERGALAIATTHYNRLKELAGSDPRFANAAAEFDRATLLPTYRIEPGVPGSSGAMWVAERMGLARDVVERARGLLDGDDRRLEALVRNLSEIRQELESERAVATRLRRETESVRADYETRLAALRGARERVLAAMSADLESAYRAAREEIAGVMRAVQRGERSDGRAASRAERRVQEIVERTKEVESEARAAEPPARAPIDWDAVASGSELTLEGVTGPAVLLEPPDRRGRVTVRLGGARVEVPAANVRAVLAGGGRGRRGGVHVERSAPAGAPPPATCDLRGLRVDEALERADAHLHRALGTGAPSVTFIHGHGSGALRTAIRDWLRGVEGVADYAPGAASEGGNGVTVARLEA
jgi:DNA mismatch repair protein MutS2